MNKFESKELLKNILIEGNIIIMSEVLINNISEYSLKLYQSNIKNVYKNSPIFYEQLKTNEVVEKYYKKFIILCSLLDYPDIDEKETFLIEWRRIHYDNNIKTLLIGPQTNSKMKFDFVKYYNSVISPHIETIDGYHQISILQNQSKEIIKINELIRTIDNTLTRIPQKATGYQLFIDTSKINRKILINDNFMIDCSQIEIGEPSLGNSMTTIKKIEYLFNNFTRLKIKLRIWKELYETQLDSLKHCFLVFDGINVFERTIYNSESDYLRIGGRFVLKGDWYEFITDFKETIFRTSTNNEFKLNDVNRFRIYIINDETSKDNEKSLKIKSNRIIHLGKVYNYLNEESVRNGFINISDRFLFDTFTNIIQELDKNKINNDFNNIYYWKEYLSEDNSEDDEKDLNKDYKTYPIQLPKDIKITQLSEWFIRRIVHNILIIIDSFSEVPEYTFENGILTIENEIKSIPCFYNGFLFKFVINELKVIKPEEFEHEGIRYRRLIFSNRDYDYDLIDRIDIDGIKLVQSNDKVPKNINQKINTFGNGRVAVEINDNDSIIFTDYCLFIRSDIKNIYYIYNCDDIKNLLKQKEIQKSSKEMELSLTFS